MTYRNALDMKSRTSTYHNINSVHIKTFAKEWPVECGDHNKKVTTTLKANIFIQI